MSTAWFPSGGRLGSLEVVVNVAGVLSFSHTHEQSLDEWNRLISINLTGTFLVCRQALPHLLATGGNIVNLASTAAHKGQPWASAYAASKGACWPSPEPWPSSTPRPACG
jgi:meso-butanediol dehydrogenase/(S,S)-butanediol dehydrogenase/diacetyl reductase